MQNRCRQHEPSAEVVPEKNLPPPGGVRLDQGPKRSELGTASLACTVGIVDDGGGGGGLGAGTGVAIGTDTSTGADGPTGTGVGAGVDIGAGAVGDGGSATKPETADATISSDITVFDITKSITTTPDAVLVTSETTFDTATSKTVPEYPTEEKIIPSVIVVFRCGVV